MAPADKVKAEPKGPNPFAVPSRTPDYNPDKERHASHSFVVQDTSLGATKTEIVLGDTVIPLKKGTAVINDEGLARELQKEYRFDATVTRMRNPKPGDSGHRYFFSMPEMPWKRKAPDGG